MDGSNQQPEGRGKERELPAPGERVMVRCHDFRCLAYRDAEGKWRDAEHDKELPEVIEVLSDF